MNSPVPLNSRCHHRQQHWGTTLANFLGRTHDVSAPERQGDSVSSPAQGHCLALKA